ncbi:hypothetical protein C483_16241 [Natrialba hulunbeirensis JCM 10989]|uniref:Uncharacterized protein n=1 Tax=Natrialba hulunbeirensis JCM 10989 TaxID=1227493 RepID=L9ZRT5_9EURY|nr:hypothetical protein [Natrialba hulunbeirensis]ELY88277.1 hypothetical protein C483_16241 [Natrialba hulunbeirensis JCM 10989]
MTKTQPEATGEAAESGTETAQHAESDRSAGDTMDADTAPDAAPAEDAEPTATDRLTEVYLSITDGEAESVVETQRSDPADRELEFDRAEEALGPAALHGLDDAIGDPDGSIS